MTSWTTQERITAGEVELDADLTLPEHATGVVLFAHASGAARLNTPNREVALKLNRLGLATLLVDLLTAEEDLVADGGPRFDVGLLADRLVGLVDWLRRQPATAALPLGVLGAGTAGGAALVAAAARPEAVRALVSRGGRPDLAGPALLEVRAPTLFVVGERDTEVLEVNEQARNTMRIRAEVRVIAGATHLFTEENAMEHVAEEAGAWLADQLGGASRPGAA